MVSPHRPARHHYSYAEYLARMLRIYQALEVTGRGLVDHPVAGALVDSALDPSAQSLVAR